jgi:hypothetical protein
MVEQGRKPDQTKPDRSQEQRIADLETQLASVRATSPLGTIPDHAAGVGQDISETWSQADQELARVGQHPLQEPDTEPEEPEPEPEPGPGPAPHKQDSMHTRK